jgi:cellulose biosynthesis protein BcsQ
MIASTKIISFVSFKGGAGRSVTLGNVALQLAKKYRVGCIDLDIEAGSLHMVFNALNTGQLSIQHILTGQLDETEEQRLLQYLHLRKIPDYYQEEFFKEKIVVDLKSHSRISKVKNSIDGELYLIQATADAGMTAFVDTGSGLFQNIYKLIRKYAEFMKLDFVLVDCRSGISNIALPGFYYCDLAVVCMRWGLQHRLGTEQLITWYKNVIEHDHRDLKIILVPTSSNSVEIPNESINEYVKSKLGNFPACWVSIPFIPELAQDDQVFYSDEKQMKNQAPFIKLTDKLLETLELLNEKRKNA